MAKYKVEMLDDYIRLRTKNNDHQIRAVLNFKSHIEIGKLKEAVKKSLHIIPILGSKYVEAGQKHYWESPSVSYDDTDYFTLIAEYPSNKMLTYVLAETPDQHVGPQLKVTVFRQPENDIVCIVFNHMVCDGSGFKSYLYLLSVLYADQNVEINEMIHATQMERSVGLILKSLSLKDKLHIFLQKDNHTDKENEIKVVLQEDENKRKPELFLLKIDAVTLNCIKSFCHAQRITVNDFMLALYYKALFEIHAVPVNSKLTMDTMIDLRRYDTNRLIYPFSNFSSSMRIQVMNKEQSFPVLATEINHITRRLKSQYPGLKSIELLTIIYKLFNRSHFENTLIKRTNSLGVSSSNVGIIDKTKLLFGDIGLSDAYMVTALKNPPALMIP